MEKYKYNDKQHPQFPTINNDWFKNVFGFDEGGITDKDTAQIINFHTDSPVIQNLEVNSSELNNVSINEKKNKSKKYNVGKVKFVSTGSLLQSITKVDTLTDINDGLKYYDIKGNAGPLHYDPQLEGSLFQAASQFNALEMGSPNVIPEDGITIYVGDKTQGPACALACPYATLYRNYFSMPGGKLQSGIRDSSNNTSYQINALEEFEKVSGFNLRKENGYFYPNDTAEAKKINDYLTTPENFWNSVKLVKYFIHEDTPVVSAIDGSVVQNVAQIYCSALPVGYFPAQLKDCPLFIKMILCAIYYATFAQAVVMAQTKGKGKRVKVLITKVGGGVFRNPPDNIDAAINSALTFFKDYPIDVYYVNYDLTITEFTNPTEAIKEDKYPGNTGEKIIPNSSFQIGGANPSSDSSGSASSSGSSGDPPSGKVAQFFMTFEKDSNGGLKSDEQAQKIVNAVKCLMAKGYKHIGLTYSANQAQTEQIFSDYKYNKDSTGNTFADGEEKNISSQILNGANQARVLTELNKIIKDNASYSEFKKAFRVIPFTTMRYEKQGTPPVEVGVDLDESKPGNNNECIEAAKAFLQLPLPDSIILGWCNQDCGKMNDALDKTKQKFAIGGGVAASLSLANSKYIPEYLQFLTSVWDEDVQKIVTECSPDPKSVDSPASPPPPSKPPATQPATPLVEKKPFDDVLRCLEGKLTNASENDAEIKTLGITLPDLSYPLNGSDTDKKNLNSADPAIDVMITAFENAMDEGDKNFYLGACRSIQAAYVLEKGTNADTSNEAMRAKLLLNLRKNSLLLKVPARWDYKETEMGVEAVPVMEPPFSVPLQNESYVFCFENVAFQLLFSIDSVRKFSETPIEQIDAKTLCNTLNITSDIPKCEGVFENTYDVLHKMSEQYKKDKSVAVEAKESKKNLEQIKNLEVTEVYTQDDGSQQADAADFLIYTILPYLKLYEPINNSICFKQYELTLCTHDINNSDLDIDIEGVDKLYKYETGIYTDNTTNKYNFSKNSVLNEIGVDVGNKKLLDILNPVGVAQTSLMCFTNGNSIQECIDDYLSEKNLEINNDIKSATYEEQTQLEGVSKCKKKDTIKRPVLYISENQKYLIVTLKRYTLNAGKTIIVDKNINVDEKITINKDIEYVNKYEFKLRGVICKTGSAGGGHYVYISYEDGKKILYNDNAIPTDFKGHEYDINATGYVFLYEKVTSQSGGSNNIPRPITYTNAANTNHAASKSKHNSSFKVSSSSKSKHKGHNRSHTQRVK